MPFFLKHVEGSKAGQLESFDRDKIRIGRQPDNELAFDPQQDASVSGYHAEVYQDGQAYFVKDLQSRNGTFVNSRRIDRPIQLEDGDVLQFSARGPKVVFTTRDPSLTNEMSIAETSSHAPTEILSAESPREEKRAHQSGLMAKIVAIGVGVALWAAVFGAGFYFGLPWWVLIAAAATASLLIGALYLGWRFWRQRRAVREQAKAAQQQREASLGRGDQDNLQDLKRKWLEVVRSLRESKLHKMGEDAVDVLPWVAVLGEPGSGKSALIKAGGPQSSILSRQQEVPTRNCDWWFFDNLVVLDLAGRYVFQGKQSDAAGEWQELLNLLRTNRRREPINGVIVALAADSLASVPVEKLKEQAAHIRECLDEILQKLGVKFPVYLAITKCDLIVGFNEFWSALPQQTAGQALGAVNSDPLNNSDAPRFLDRGFRTICERIERLRLAQIVEEQQESAVHRMFLFPAELKSLHVPLKAFVDVLFRPSPYQDVPFFRGFFLTSARQAGSPMSRLSRLLGSKYAHVEARRTNRDLFLRDLYSTILPSDRNLTAHTAVGRERHRLAWAAGLICIASAALLFSVLFSWSFYNNKLALAETDPDLTYCRTASPSGTKAKTDATLIAFERCQNTIGKLDRDSFRKHLSLNFGLNHTDEIQASLRENFVKNFDANFLTVIDSQINQKLKIGVNAPLLAGTIFQRMEILSECLESGCPDPERQKDKWNRVDYGVMLLAKDPEFKADDTTVGRLQTAYQSFLHWQTDAEAYRAMYEKYYQQIFAWINLGNRWKTEIFTSVNARFAPVKAADLWRIDLPLKVDPLYTATAWQKGLSPLLAGLEKVSFQGHDFKNDIKDLEQNYKEQALQRWGEFLLKFPEGEAQARLTSRELALKVLAPNSPYQGAIASAHENLSGIFGEAWPGTDAVPWTKTLKRYVELNNKLPRMKNTKESIPDDERQAVTYIDVYLEALKQLPSKFATPQESFTAAQSALREGQSSNKPAQPILQAFWAIRMLRGSALFRDNEPTFWALLERPVHLAWKAMLDGAGESLQQQWRQIYFAMAPLQNSPWPSEGLSPGMQASKVMEFVNGPAVGFLKPRGSFGYSPNVLEGQSVPFTGQFIAFISTLGTTYYSSNLNIPRDIVRNR
jgi:hypothetical protein